MSKLTIVLVAYNRPLYLEQSSKALMECQGFRELVDSIHCSVDDCTGRGTMCYHQLKRLAHINVPFTVNGHIGRKGIVGNTILGMKYAFEHGAENVLMLEDDAVLMPDALRLASWMCDQDTSGVLTMSLAAHGDEKCGPKPSEDPSLVGIYNFITCPFAYIVKREHWPFILKNWCCKEYHPCGWSWSLSYAGRMAGMSHFGPMLSRCRNIGRESGTNETPETWDRLQTGHNFSDGAYQGDYGLVQISKDMRAMDEWMLNEVNKVPEQRYDRWVGFGKPKELDL